MVALVRFNENISAKMVLKFVNNDIDDVIHFLEFHQNAKNYTSFGSSPNALFNHANSISI